MMLYRKNKNKVLIKEKLLKINKINLLKNNKIT